MNQNICMNCRWWEPCSKSDFEWFVRMCREGENPLYRSSECAGRCHYNPPHHEFPTAFAVDWCRMFEHKDSKG